MFIPLSSKDFSSSPDQEFLLSLIMWYECVVYDLYVWVMCVQEWLHVVCGISLCVHCVCEWCIMCGLCYVVECVYDLCVWVMCGDWCYIISFEKDEDGAE